MRASVECVTLCTMVKKAKKATKSEFLSVRVSAATKAALARIAEEQDRSLSWVVGRLLDDYVARKGRSQ